MHFHQRKRKRKKKKKYPKKLFKLLEDLNLLEDCNLCKIERYDNIFSWLKLRSTSLSKLFWNILQNFTKQLS